MDMAKVKMACLTITVYQTVGKALTDIPTCVIHLPPHTHSSLNVFLNLKY